MMWLGNGWRQTAEGGVQRGMLSEVSFYFRIMSGSKVSLIACLIRELNVD